MTSKTPARSADDIDEATLSYAEIDDLHNKIENGKTELAAPFPQQDEFERLSLRSAELSHLLNEDVDSDEKEKSNLNLEKQRRFNAIFNGEYDSLCAKYFFPSLRKKCKVPMMIGLTSATKKPLHFF